VYPSLSYSGTPKAASLGTNGTATGVGAISPAWTIDNKSSGPKQQAEAIDFSPGSDTNDIGTNRVFTDAQIPVQRKDTGVAQNPSVTVQLAEFDSAVPPNLLGTQNCTITGNTGTQILADPTNAAVCAVATPAAAGGVPSSFQTIEVRDTTTSTSISVVGPTATFDLASTVCSGQTVPSIDNGGGVSATLTLPSVPAGTPPICKTYTSFSSTIQGGKATLSFNGFSASPVQFTVHVTWPLEKLCQPYSDTAQNPAPGGSGIPPDLTLTQCDVHQVSFDNVIYYDQTYCQIAQNPAPVGEPQAGLCTTNKTFNNNDPNTGVPLVLPNTNPAQPATQITETWVGDIDWYYH
jgi:hypothetical protein